MARPSSFPIMIWYADPDAALCQKLELQLAPMVQSQRITLWHKGLLLGGEDQLTAVESHIRESRMLLVLVSADSLVELQTSSPVLRAVLQQKPDETVVLPVLLRPTLWEESSLAGFLPLPRNGRAVTQWDDPEAALLEIARGVETMLPPAGVGAHAQRSSMKRRWRVAAATVLGLVLIASAAAAVMRQSNQMDAYEVTNADFAGWLNGRKVDIKMARLVYEGELLLDLYRDDDGGSGVRWVDGRFEARPGAERLPVVQVSYTAAQRYCAAHGARLPRPAEWLSAACGPLPGRWLARKYPWGDEAPRCDGVVYGRVHGACQHLAVGPVAVGTAAQDRTPQGIRDLGGNVAEWVYGPQVRGGDYGRAATECPDLRVDLPAEAVRSNVGFRCAH